MQSLVEYDSSSEEEDNVINHKRKAVDNIQQNVNKMPKLPSFFQPSKKVNMSEHQGRTRTIPHQEDSWATYVYCKVDLSEELKLLSPSLKNVELIEEPHISLSRPIYFRKFQLNPFVEQISKQMKSIHSFDISFAQTAVLNNDEQTRSFFTLEIGKGYNELFECMQLVDETLIKFRKDTFYDPPRFHASIAWSLKEKDVQDIHVSSAVMDDISKTVYPVTAIFIKMGNRIEQIALKNKKTLSMPIYLQQ